MSRTHFNFEILPISVSMRHLSSQVNAELKHPKAQWNLYANVNSHS
jgi:hypothetical protein